MKIISLYLKQLVASIITHLWAGIWTAIGIIIIMKATNTF